MKLCDARYKRPQFKKMKGVEFSYISMYFDKLWFFEDRHKNLLNSKKKLPYVQVIQLRLFK